MDDNQVKTFTEDYVKELREEAKSYRLKLREREQEIEELKQLLNKKEVEFNKQLETLKEQLGEFEKIKKELEVYKPKAQTLEEKIKNQLLEKIPDDELKKQALEKFDDIEKLEFFVNSISNFLQRSNVTSTMDSGTKTSSNISAEAEYLKALRESRVADAIAIKNQLYKEKIK
jgi:vacuolar-type H+-ATPase subunit I/STV1